MLSYFLLRHAEEDSNCIGGGYNGKYFRNLAQDLFVCLLTNSFISAVEKCSEMALLCCSLARMYRVPTVSFTISFLTPSA